MQNEKRKRRLVLAFSNGITYVAIWQFMGFALLLLLVWANEVIDFAALFYGEQSAGPNWIRGLLSSAAVILAAVVVVGNTYLQQHAIVSGMLTICSYCHKITLDKDVWQRVEEHLMSNPMLQLSHGICPDCIDKVKESWEAEEQEAKG